jgi:predicted  nucleic acid-binding Zn-ribbon protein
MSTPAVLFREVHRLRRYIHELQEQLARAPRQLQAQKNKVARQEELQREGQEHLKKLKVSIHEKEVSLKSTHGLIAKHLKQMETASEKKEYDALQLEIKQERELANRLEDEILAAMAETEERTAKLPELEQNVQKARREFAEWEKGAGERQANLESQLSGAQAQLTEAEAQLEAQLPKLDLGKYQRVANAMGPDALSAVRGRTCEACSTEITAQMHNDLLMGNFVMCKACGRILYLPE